MIMDNKEFKIGEVFQCGLIKLRCEESKSCCNGCFLFNLTNCQEATSVFTGSCLSRIRKDKTDVIFVKVDD